MRSFGRTPSLFRFALMKCVIIMNKSITFEKSKIFAVRIVKLYNHLKDNKKEYVLSKQLLRCGTSIGANIAEAECAIGRKDFHSKMYIAYKECAESMYWIDILHDSEYLTDLQYESINNDCQELYKLLASITKSIKSEEND